MAKILIVDDDALLLQMYKSKFEEDGFDVEVAVDGGPAFTKASETKPDLILLDIMMPKVNGLEVLKKLKKSKETKTIPVIILTNVGGSEEDVEQGLSLGAAAYMVKASYTSKQVVQKVKEVLAGNTRELPKVKVPIKPETSKAKKKALEKAKSAKHELEKAVEKVEETTKKLKET